MRLQPDFSDVSPLSGEPSVVHALIEIPKGCRNKFEVDKESGALKQEYRDGKPRIVDFLGYPGNYGLVPLTLLAKDSGGDGDPLDVLGTVSERDLE